MANEEHLARLKQGVQIWNKWREENPGITPDLTDADLRVGTDLTKGNFVDADLTGANLPGAKLADADLSRAKLAGATLYQTNFSKANLTNAYLSGANLTEADLTEANLTEADLSYAHLKEVILIEANLTKAYLFRADIDKTNFAGAKLIRANLEYVQLINSNFKHATLEGCEVFGISAWDLELEGAQQKDLIITRENKSKIKVANLEVAPFLSLLLHNEKIRDIIDTITSKVVLILGRFTDERKSVLDALKDSLRQRGFVSILFDFPPSERRDLTETAQLLANMAKFVIADITEAKSISQELSHIIPFFPSVPVQPILLASEREYELFEHWSEFKSVLPVFRYKDGHHLIENLDAKVIQPAEARVRELDEKRKAKKRN
jgi:uncharacterized protein YjbI with pentapeptide repeats